MPELPEVETIVRDLNAADLIGRRIVGALVLWSRTLAAPAPADFAAAVQGRTILAVARRGKYIVLRLDDAWTLLMHLRMTGRLAVEREPPQEDRHTRLALCMDDGRWLSLRDPRKFGRVWLLPAHAPSPLDALGVEPLSRAFSAALLTRLLGGRTAVIKSLLLDQRLIAGVGNIYADEALWLARIHPRRPGASLSGAEVERLRRAIRRVLRQSLRSGGTSLGAGKGNFYGLRGQPGRHLERLKVYRRAQQPCTVCGATIQRIVVAQRGTHFCPRCQTRVSCAFNMRLGS